MIADAFSIFDYGGAIGLVRLVRWVGRWIAL